MSVFLECTKCGQRFSWAHQEAVDTAPACPNCGQHFRAPKLLNATPSTKPPVSASLNMQEPKAASFRPIYWGIGILASAGALFWGLVFCLLLFVSFANTNRSASPDNPIQRVLLQHALAMGQLDTEMKGGADLRDALAHLDVAFRQIDIRGCPTDFSEAFVRYVHAMRAVQGNLPESTGTAILEGMLNGLNGEIDGGATRKMNRYNEDVRTAQSLWGEVEAIAARHGSALQ